MNTLSLNPEALGIELQSAVRARVPSSIPIDTGLVSSLLESWDLQGEWREAMLFVSRRFLEELQDDVMLGTHAVWPITPDGAAWAAEAHLDDKAGVLHLEYVSPAGEIVTVGTVELRRIVDV